MTLDEQSEAMPWRSVQEQAYARALRARRIIRTVVTGAILVLVAVLAWRLR